MRAVGALLAFLFLIGLLGLGGYAAYKAFGFLTLQWDVLGPEWKSGLIVISSVLLLCALFLSGSIGSFIRRYSARSTGKVIAYNEFISWYSELKNGNPEALDAGSFRKIGNQLTLWGNRYVVKQSHLLHELLVGEQASQEDALKKADGLYLEIRRDLGYRGAQVDRQIS